MKTIGSIFLLLFLALAPASRAQVNQCVAGTGDPFCSPAPSVTLSLETPGATNSWPVYVIGTNVFAKGLDIYNTGYRLVPTTNEQCEAYYDITALSSTVISNWWEASGPDVSFTTNGSGLIAAFIANHGVGTGKVAFHVTYSNPDPCVGVYTNHLTNTFTVIEVGSLAPTNDVTWTEINIADPNYRTFLVPQVSTTAARTNVAVYGTPNPVIPPQNLPMGWWLNGVRTNRMFIDITTVATNTVICTAGTSSKTNIIIVAAAPAITQQPVSQTVLSGNNARFTVTATGTQPLHYQWFFNASAVADATNSALTLAHVQTNNSGTYYVVITNFAGTVTSSNATLLVGFAPLVTQNPVSRTNLAGTTATFSVVATGSPVVSYQWRKGGSNLANGGNVAGATAANLTLSSVQDTDVASYTVYITNFFGVVTSTPPATLTVTHLPQITAQPSPASQTVPQGTNVTISVTATGTTPLSYQWRLNGTNIDGATESIYTRSDVQPMDAGSYSVVITNTVGTITSSNAIVNVIIPPTIVTQPTNQLVVQNSPATFAVSATGTAPLHYQWYYDGTFEITDATNATLTIEGTIPSDEGAYSVVITNSAGSVTSAQATLALVVAPSVTNPQSTNVVAGSSVTLSVAADGTAPLSYQWRRNGSNLAGQTSSAFSIGVVHTSDQGSYSVVVANSAGSVTSGNGILTVTTPPSIVTQPSDRVVAQATVATFSVSAAGSATLTYQWYTNGVAVANGSKYSGATSSTLSVNNAGSADVVVYSARVSNSGGSIDSVGAHLSVVGVSRLVVDGSSPEVSGAATIGLGSSIVLRAIPSSTPAGVGFPAGYPVWSASDNTLTLPGAGAATATITPTNAGQYTIWATCGISNSFVITVNSTNDANYDGIVDNLEDLNNPPQIQMGFWSFDTLDLAGLQGQSPLTSSNVASVGGWSILAAQIDSRSNGPTVLNYREAQTNALVSNINLRRGTVRFMFNPDWSSTTVSGGTGPQTDARLLEIGDKASSSGCFGIYLDQKGTNVTFCTRTNGGSLITNLTGSVKLTNDNWYQFDFTYSPTNASFYLNGKLVTNNTAGVSVYPGATVRANGFRIGGGLDASGKGTNNAQGSFDSFETYNYPWSGPAVDNYYKHHPQPIATNTCLLAPMALYVSIATTLTNGQVATTTNAAGQGNFVWLNWYHSSTFPLKEALTNWAYSQQFTNANDSTDSTLSTGDWIWADTGWQSSVTSSLDWLINKQTNFGVVLWNNSTGTGNNTKYEAAEYAKIQLLAYDGSAKTITYKYLGLTSCDSYSNQPPTVTMVSPPNNTIYTVASNSTATVPLTAAAFDPENNLTGVTFYWGATDATCTNLLAPGDNVGSITSTNGTTNLYNFTWANAPHGTNSVLAVATDALSQSATSQVIRVVVNWSPYVAAGANITNIWVEGSSTFVTNLTSSVWDDGLPYHQTNFAWTILRNDGPVSLASPTSASTTATFSSNGVYQFQIAADDGVATNYSQCYVRILRRPFIDITSPTNNETIFAGPDITVSAAAYDLDGRITGVQFSYVFNGVTNLIGAGSATTGATNYVVDWTNAPIGSNITLIAVATDDDNLTKTSSIPVAIISPYPSIQIVSPIDQHFIARTLTNIYAVAAPAISTSPITNVQFFVFDGTRTTSLGNVTNTVGGFYQVKWLAAKPGTNIFTASVTDNRNSNALSAPVTNYVRGTPVVTITTPTNGSRYYLTTLSTNIDVTATAIADSANITNIAFYRNKVLFTNVAVNAQSATRTVTLKNVTNGTYVLQAQATDNGGAIGSSTNVTFTVLPINQPPSVYAGPDQIVNLSTNPVQLAGIVADDGLPSNYLATAWSQVSGPGPAMFSDIHNLQSTVTLTNAGTNILQLWATDGQLTATSTVAIVVRSCYAPPFVDAGPSNTLVLPALANTNVISTIRMTRIATAFNSPISVDYFPNSNSVILSVNYSSGLPNNFELVSPADGTRTPFSTVSNLTDEVYMATVRDTVGGFTIGEMFCGSGNSGEVMRIKPDGTTFGTNGVNANAWVVLTNRDGVEPGLLRGGVYVDRTGVWGGDLMVSTTSGNVYRVKSNGQFSQVCHIPDFYPNGESYYEGVLTVPNDSRKYGPWAGRVLIGGETANRIFAIDTNGFGATYDLGIQGTEDIRLIPTGENMFGVDFSASTLWGAAWTEFQGMEGDILVAEEFSGNLYRVSWNGETFQKVLIGDQSGWEGLAFAPAGITNVAPAQAVHLQGYVTDECTNAAVVWIKESGPGPVTFDQPNVTNTLARFSEPGTYYLRLLANDGQFAVSDFTRVDVIRNQIPIVDAGTNQIVPDLNNIHLTGTVIDDGLPKHQTNVYWMLVAGPSDLIDFLTPSNQLSTTVRFYDPGTYVMRLVADDGEATNSAEVTITTASTNLTVIPAYGWATRINTQYEVTARAIDQNNNPLPGAQIDFSVSGANWGGYSTNADSSGYATFVYSGSNPGRDLITATVNGQSISTTVIKDWGVDISCGSSVSSLYSQCWSLDWPTNQFHYSDYFVYSATSGSNFVANYANYSHAALVLRDPSHKIVSVSTTGTLSYTPLTAGDYLIEMTDVMAGQLPEYDLTFSCGTNIQHSVVSPEMQVYLNGTNVPNGSTIIFPTRTIGSPTNISLVISNVGSDWLNIPLSTNTGDFSLSTNLSGAHIAISGTTNLGVTFNASSNETSVGVLYLQHDARDQNNLLYYDNYIVYLVGSAFAPGTNPVVRITSPGTNDSFYSPATIPITAVVTPGSTNVSYVYFQEVTTGAILGSVTNGSSNTYTLSWANVPDGTYGLTAVAVDAEGRSGAASPVSVQVQPANGDQPPFALPDSYSVMAASQNNFFTPQENDSDPDGDSLRVVSVTAPQLAGATVTIVGNGAAISYNPPPNLPFGTDHFTYEISDGRGMTSRSSIAITIYPPAKPDVWMVAPVYAPNTNYTSAGAVVPLTAYVQPYQAVVKVDFFLGESLIGTVTNGTQGFYTLSNWKAVFSDCGCGINAQATDKFGQVGSAQPIYIAATNSDVISSAPELNNNLSFEASSTSTNYFDTVHTDNVTVIRDGIVDIYGYVLHALGSNVTWQLGVFNLDGTPVKNLTPPPYDSVGGCTRPVGSGTGEGVLVKNGDFTTIPNGMYYLILSSTSGQIHKESKARIQLESNLKIGQFSFSQQDLVIPVKGIPLTLTRTYNSLNPNRGDFGYSWTMALMDMDVQLDEERTDVEGYSDDDGSRAQFSLRTGGFRDVTLTLPTGQRTTFYYNIDGDILGNYTPLYQTQPGLPAGVHLTPQGNPRFQGQYAYGQYGWVGYNGMEDDFETPEEAGDFPGWVLSMPDGSSYIIDREDLGTYQTEDGYFVHAYGKPYLAEIDERSGDRITIDKNGITYSSVSGATRHIAFERNEAGLIKAITDPNGSESGGPPAIKYDYDVFENLVEVERLVDSATYFYVTNTYAYQNPTFPHYITAMYNGDGIQVAKNFYDDDGKLIAVQDANGKVTHFIHNTTNNIEMVVDRLNRTNTFVYNSHGDLLAETNALGQVTLNTFDDSNHLLSTTDPLNHTIRFDYDAFGNRTQIIDPLNRTNFFTYDSNLLTGHTDPLGNVTTNFYDGAGNLIGTMTLDSQGHTTQQSTSVYSDGQLIQTMDANGRTNAAYAYDPTTGYLTNATDASGTTTYFEYDANGHVTKSSFIWNSPDGSHVPVTSSTIYDEQGRVIIAIDADNNTNRTFYDLNGRVSCTTDKFGNTNTFLYDSCGNLIQTTYPDGTYSRTVYNDNAQPILKTDLNEVTATLTEYDAAGQVTNTVRLANVRVGIENDPVSPGQKRCVIYDLGTVLSSNSVDYFANGWVQSRKGVDGQTTIYEYWPTGQVKTITDPLHHNTYFEYDDAGNRTLMADALNHTNLFVYDAVGRHISTMYGDGSYTSNAFDIVGRQVSQVDQSKLSTQFNYNLAGQLTNVIKPQVLDPSGNPVNPTWSFRYDQFGQMAASTDPLNRTNTYFYDAQGRIIGQKLPMGQTATNVYNSKGQLWKLYDFKGQHTEFVYDRFARLRARFLFASNAVVPDESICYVYNSLNRLSEVVERYGVDATTNACDGYATLVGLPPVNLGIFEQFFAKINQTPNASAGLMVLAFVLIALALLPRQKRQSLAILLQQAWMTNLAPTFGLGASGSVLRRSRRLQLPAWGWRITTFVALTALMANEPGFDRLWTARADCPPPSNPNSSTATTRYTYFTYDVEGRVLQVNSPEGVINYGYDIATGRLTETCTANSEEDYGYDTLGRLETVTVVKRNGSTLTVPETTTYHYDSVGNRSEVYLPNGVVSSYRYDNLNRLTNLVHQLGTTNLATYSYKVDATGRRTNAVEKLRTESSGATYLTNTITWQYDGMHRLTNEACASSIAGTGYTNSFQYDQVGNRVKKVRTGAGADTIIYQYNENDQLTNEISGTSTTRYAYDENGSLTNKTTGATVNAYEYNVANKLRAVTINGSLAASYLYNEQGIRVQTTASGVATHYLVDDNNHTGNAQVLEELATSGSAPTRSYTIGNEVLSQCGSGGATPSYFLMDGHGSNRQLTQSDGMVSGRYNYDAYGEVVTGTSSSSAELAPTTKLYCGEQYDSNLRMYNLRARYYDPATGRFNQRDTLEGSNFDPEGLHKYTYCNLDPGNRIDPSGNQTEIEILIVEAIQTVLFAINAVSVVRGALAAVYYGFAALNAWINGYFWEGLGYAIVAAFNGISAALSYMGMKAAFNPPSGMSGPGLNLAFAGGAGGGGVVWQAAVAHPEAVLWGIKIVAPAAFGVYMMMKGQSVRVQEHHKVPWRNSKYNFQDHPLVKKAGINLKKDPRNLMDLANHAGRHCSTYLEAVLARLDNAWAALGANPSKAAAEAKFAEVVEQIEKDISTGKLRPYDPPHDVWIPD